MSRSPGPAQPATLLSLIAGLVPVLVALPLIAGGVVLLGSTLGFGLPLIEIVITAGWARLLFLVAGTYLLFDGGRMLTRVLGIRPGRPSSPEDRRRLRLLSRARLLGWIAVLGVLTVALPFRAFHVVRGLEYLLPLLVVVILLLAFLSVTGSLMASGSLDPEAARWIVPGRTLDKLEAGAGLRGHATIDAMHETGWRVNENPQVHFELTVSIAGHDPYRTRVTEVVPLLALGRVVRGGSLPVIVDADAPEHLLVRWKDL